MVMQVFAVTTEGEAVVVVVEAEEDEEETEVAAVEGKKVEMGRVTVAGRVRVTTGDAVEE